MDAVKVKKYFSVGCGTSSEIFYQDSGGFSKPLPVVLPILNAKILTLYTSECLYLAFVVTYKSYPDGELGLG